MWYFDGTVTYDSDGVEVEANKHTDSCDHEWTGWGGGKEADELICRYCGDIL